MSKRTEPVILSAVRTPIGKFLGALSSIPAPKLGAVAIKAAVERAGLSKFDEIDEVLIGNVVQAGVGQAPARQAAIFAGLPVTVSATTLNKVCGSGLKVAMFCRAGYPCWRRTAFCCRRYGINVMRALSRAGSQRRNALWPC